MQGSFLFLGTGASAGVPVIGCHCAICSSNSPRNRRLRSSGLIEVGSKRFLIDVGPDFREQALTHKIEKLDGLLLTHTHYDHIAGIDELRIYNIRGQKPMPCLLSKESFADIQKRYDYFFKEQASMSAQFTFQLLEDGMGSVEFEGMRFDYLSYSQQGMRVNGYRFGSFAYVSDIREYDESIFTSLKGVKQLVLSALRFEPSKVHFSIEEAIEFARIVGASQTYLTHISHNVDYEADSKKLPPGIHLGCDGLKIEFSL